MKSEILKKKKRNPNGMLAKLLQMLVYGMKMYSKYFGKHTLAKTYINYTHNVCLLLTVSNGVDRT